MSVDPHKLGRVSANWVLGSDDPNKFPVVTVVDSNQRAYKMKAGPLFAPQQYEGHPADEKLMRKVEAHFKNNLYTLENKPFYTAYVIEASFEFCEEQRIVKMMIHIDTL